MNFDIVLLPSVEGIWHSRVTSFSPRVGDYINLEGSVHRTLGLSA